MTKDKVQINCLKLMGVFFLLAQLQKQKKWGVKKKNLLRDENWVSILIQILTDWH